MNELIINGLSKTYANGVRALDDVSLTIPSGMFGLLGPNGAGKSTLMRTIATLQPADGGSITFGELDVLRQQHEVREILGYLPQAFGLYPTITGERLLDHLAILKGLINKAERQEVVSGLLQKTNLYHHRKKKLSTYSGGMKQRFGIAQALLGNPSLLIVDEPTAGLDPTERNRFYNLLSALGENRIVILSTHIVEDVKELCPQMAIIHQGRVLLQGNPLQTIDSLRGKIFRKFVNRENLEAYHQEYAVIAERRLQGKPLIHIYRDSAPGDGFEQVEADLNDVYFTQLLGAG
ncbi:ABC transporter ATP-binding protein [Neolewinella persica]|uniref:ABC transporter ATP-binding protein n=1 Tax=Neolewinella persica TaxID=70998 RepID=UPI000379D6EB|nr:ABC transporter ATP-binding protein [Neolewinella persica]